jgi:hypothetical protein
MVYQFVRTALMMSAVALAIGHTSLATAQNASSDPRFGKPQQQRQAPPQARPQPPAQRPPVIVQQARPQIVQQARPQPQYSAPRRVEERRRGPDGRAIAGGIAAGVIGGIIINEAVRSRRYRSEEVEIIEDAPPPPSCSRLADLCDDGERWACKRLNRECDE